MMYDMDDGSPQQPRKNDIKPGAFPKPSQSPRVRHGENYLEILIRRDLDALNEWQRKANGVK
jgi:hypothetical protein